jgi:hypothetical protein
MKKKETPKGLLMTGSFRRAGMTFYLKQGQVIARVSKSTEKRSNTLGQFVQRQRMRHTIALWQMLRPCNPMFTQRKTAYQNFASLANRLPVVYVSKTVQGSGTSFLMPDIPVSDGTLPVVKQWLGEAGGIAALLTNLKATDLKRGEVLVLYTAEQRLEGRTPRMRFVTVREVSLSEMTEVDGCLALTGEEFDDEMKGWALVRVNGDRCSAQAIVTRCTYYQQFTTDEALKTAAKSYGGLTD